MEYISGGESRIFRLGVPMSDAGTFWRRNETKRKNLIPLGWEREYPSACHLDVCHCYRSMKLGLSVHLSMIPKVDTGLTNRAYTVHFKQLTCYKTFKAQASTKLHLQRQKEEKYS